MDEPEESTRLARLGVDLLCTDAVARVGSRRGAVVPARTASAGRPVRRGATGDERVPA
ncbi:hypothetical protein [Geodermatophilus sp. URMC 65]